jgi:hypothetical protein
MPSSREMYEQGQIDAESDDLKPFLYQHYYYYRQGYDDARRRIRRLPPLAAWPMLVIPTLLIAAVAGVVWLLWNLSPAPPAVAETAPSAVIVPTTAAVTAQPVPTLPPLPTATPEPSPTPTGLYVGGRARVANLNGSTLRARSTPGMTEIVARIPEGSIVRVVEGPVVGDGFTWWRVESDSGAGWCAAESSDGTQFLLPVP